MKRVFRDTNEKIDEETMTIIIDYDKKEKIVSFESYQQGYDSNPKKDYAFLCIDLGNEKNRKKLLDLLRFIEKN